MSVMTRYSIGDWCVTLVLVCVGIYLDKQAPFERAIGPQLADPNIAYPHTPTAQQHVPTDRLFLLAGVLPLCVLVAIQLLRPCRHELNQAILGLVSSLAITLCFICLVKNAVGRLRPDFLARCRPVDGRCTGEATMITEGRKSFPSGHTALSFGGLGYLSLYLAAKLAHRTSSAGSLWKVCVAATPWLGALYIGLTRLEDYWHHWEDVLVGGIIGNLASYGCYRLRYPSPDQGSEPHVSAAAAREHASAGKLSPAEDDERNPFV